MLLSIHERIYDLDLYLDFLSLLRDLLLDFLLFLADLDLSLLDLLGGLGLLLRLRPLLLLLLTSLSSSLLESESESDSWRPLPFLPPILLVVACLVESSLELLTATISITKLR